ncbi:exonuclease SbcCD subunit D [Thermodesulfobacteriota bacterium]
MDKIHNRRNRPPLTILHTADLHLNGKRGEPSEEHDETESGFRALKGIVATANHLAVDLVLVSGDLFDTCQPEEEVVAFVLEQLSHLRPPVILIPGNHDCLGDTGVYHMPVWNEVGDDNLKLITAHEGETFEAPGLPLIVWGRAMIEHSPDFKPLEGLPQRNGNTWQIAMAHGFFYANDEYMERSSPISARQIRCSGWDYIALGHNHAGGDVSQGPVKAAYSGSPVNFLNRKAQALLIVMDDQRDDPVSIKHIPIPSPEI